jgi:hypothetical protein
MNIVFFAKTPAKFFSPKTNRPKRNPHRRRKRRRSDYRRLSYEIKRGLKTFSFVSALLVCLTLFASAQTPLEPEDNQSWNDVQLAVPMSKHFDFYTSVTMRFGKNATRLNDGRFAIGFIYKPNKRWSFQPFYWHIVARNARGAFRTEHRLNLRVGYRFPFKNFGLTHRSGFEYRLRRPQNSWRWRPSLTFEKDLPEKFMTKAKFFVTEEVFYDSLLKKLSRNRFSVGINKVLNKILSVDVFYMRQNDGFSRPGDLHVGGATWRVRL